MSDWSCSDSLHFLECYQGEPCIWDPSHQDHKDKKKVADAWSRLSSLLNKEVTELKTKKEILMVTFRRHLKKKQESIRSGGGIEDIYQSNWFAYQLMESFLLPIYATKLGLNSERQSRSSETLVEEIFDDTEETQSDSSLANTSTALASGSQRKAHKSRRRTVSHLAEQQMATAFNQLTNALNQRKSDPSDTEDECDLYAKLLAKKLRELPQDERKLMMYEIDGLFIQKIRRRTLNIKEEE